MLEIDIKRYLRITHIISSLMWHLPTEVFDLASVKLENWKKIKIKKTQSVTAKKKAFNWEINIKMWNSYQRYF